ncbi:MAG: Hsp20/alpha crystallin family protein [Kiloniellales bacterium]|nr:Hsp20/alpha crystallin family protein [Kiloniellales bacterium]
MANKQVEKASAKAPAHGAADWPFAPMMDLRKRMDDLFEGYMRGWPRFPSQSRDLWDRDLFGKMPAGPMHDMIDVRFDVSESDDAIEITAELPGMDETDVELTMADGVLTIKGEKKAESEEKKKKDFYLSERHYGAFSRSFRVPDTVNAEAIKATYDKGVLHLSLPKHAEAKAKEKKIAISKK